MARLSLRARVAIVFAAVMLVLQGLLSVVVYMAMAGALLDEIDAGLRFRAAAILSSTTTSSAPGDQAALEEPGEAFDQLLDAQAHVLRTSTGIPDRPLLSAQQLARVHGAVLLRARVTGVQDQARLLAVPAGNGQVLVVGTTMADRTDALHELLAVVVLAGPVAVLLACLAGYGAAGVALRPIERMRIQADAIRVSGLDHRLDLPTAQDELHRLGVTLNAMLATVEQTVGRERSFLELASHELRTPLTALKAELDLAVTGPQDLPPLLAAVTSASQETNRLVRLAQDLLSLARLADGRLPLQRTEVDVARLTTSTCDAFQAAARQQRVTLVCQTPESLSVQGDELRLRQALDNLLDNALRHAQGRVTVLAEAATGGVRVRVADDGPGFAPSAAPGLGLRIVEAVAVSHGGTLHISQATPHGADVELLLPTASG